MLATLKEVLSNQAKEQCLCLAYISIIYQSLVETNYSNLNIRVPTFAIFLLQNQMKAVRNVIFHTVLSILLIL